MKLHEYQAKKLLTQFGLPVPRGDAALTPAEARDVAERLGGCVIVKAQIHAGGRGKGGGVKVADGVTEAERIAGDMLGMTLVTAQTGPSGRMVRRLLKLKRRRLGILSDLSDSSSKRNLTRVRSLAMLSGGPIITVLPATVAPAETRSAISSSPVRII